MAEVLAGPSGLTRQHLPVPSAGDIGKYLKIDANGNPIYYTETPGGTVTEAGANAANDVGAATGATTALKLANLTANATETQEGVAELATAAEIVTGTDTTRVPNVANLKTSLASDGMWLTKRAKMPDVTGVVDSQDAWADRYGWSTDMTFSSPSAGIARFAYSSSYTTKNITGLAGKTALVRWRNDGLKSSRIVCDSGINIVLATISPSTSWQVTVVQLPASMTVSQLGFQIISGGSGNYIEIDWYWIGDLDATTKQLYTVGTISEEAARIADQLGDSAGVGVAASGSLAIAAGNVSAGDYFEVGGKRYTFRAATGDLTAEGDVLIGATNVLSAVNAVFAINRYDGSIYNYNGSDPRYYIAAKNPLVYGTPSTGAILLYAGQSTSSYGSGIPATGELGNSITLTESTSGVRMTKSGTTLSGGYSDVAAKMSTAVANASQGLTAKTSGAQADYELLLDSAAGFVKKKVLKSNLESTTQASGKRALYNAAAGLNANSISFPAVQSASADANTLDDYEEGTWTPTIVGSSTAGTQTYDYQVGWYTKVGRKVVANFNVRITAKDAGIDGSVNIGGLPIAANGTTNYDHMASVHMTTGVTLDTGYTDIVGQTGAAYGTSVIRLLEKGSGKSASSLPVSAIAATTQFKGVLIYIV